MKRLRTFPIDGANPAHVLPELPNGELVAEYLPTFEPMTVENDAVDDIDEEVGMEFAIGIESVAEAGYFDADETDVTNGTVSNLPLKRKTGASKHVFDFQIEDGSDTDTRVKRESIEGKEREP